MSPSSCLDSISSIHFCLPIKTGIDEPFDGKFDHRLWSNDQFGHHWLCFNFHCRQHVGDNQSIELKNIASTVPKFWQSTLQSEDFFTFLKLMRFSANLSSKQLTIGFVSPQIPNCGTKRAFQKCSQGLQSSCSEFLLPCIFHWKIWELNRGGSTDSRYGASRCKLHKRW